MSPGRIDRTVEQAAHALSQNPDRALVIADDAGVFLAVARSLGRAGIEVHVATSEHDYPGLESRYVAQVHSVPPYLKRREEWLESVRSLAISQLHRMIVPTSDSSLVLLAQYADRFGAAHVAVPNREARAAFIEKAATRELAKSLGVPVAKGVLVGPGTSAKELEHLLGLPLVLKPRSSYQPGRSTAKTPASIVGSSDQLALQLARDCGLDLLAERYFPGEGVGVSVLANQGEISLAWQHRRLAAVNPAGRSSARAGEELDPVLLRDVTAMVAAVRLTGVAMFEFRQNGDGSHILVEVNPRFWGSLPLAVAGGADFPARLWRQMIGAETPACAPITKLRMKSLQAELERLSYLQGTADGSRWQCARELAGLMAEALCRPASFDGWAQDDPRPHLTERRAVFGRLVRRLTASLGKFRPQVHRTAESTT